MKRAIGLLIFGLLLQLTFLPQASAQRGSGDRLVYRGDNFFRIENYEQAFKNYQEAIEEGNTSPEVYYKAGVSALNLSDINEQLKALPYLEKAAKTESEEVSDKLYYYLGIAYYKNSQMTEAIDYLSRYKKSLPASETEEIEKIKRELKVAENALKLIENPRETTIYPFNQQINSQYTEYNPVVAADESVMAFTALRPNEGRSRSGAEFIEEIHVSYRDNYGNWSEPEAISIRSQFNYGTAGLSADGREMLIFIGSGNNAGNLYTIKKKDGEWTQPVTMGKMVNSNFLESTASITPDRKIIYFASNRPGGFGGMDIYRVMKKEDGSWTKAENLGPQVNTEFDDDAPFIHPDKKTLFFTSDGHNTMGGKDIFKTVYIGGEWQQPTNMGYPINTIANDNYFTLTADGRKGYFSSDRPGGQGGQDIYWLDMPESERNIPLTMVKGRILAGDELKPVPTEITVVDNEAGKKIDYVYNPSIETGNYLIILPPGKNYDLIIEAEEYLPYTVNINIPNQTYFYELYQKIHLKPIKQFDVIVGQEVTVKNAFYDQKKDRVTEVRKANEAMLVKNDSLDLYEMMDAIISAEDTTAYEYVLDLMYKVNPIDDVDFEEVEGSEVASTEYFYDESNIDNLDSRVVEGETIYSLPTLYVTKEAARHKEKKKKEVTYDAALLDKQYKVYFQVGDSDIKDKYHEGLNEMLTALKEHPGLGIEISGFASAEGDPEKNRQLSNERAISVLNYFNHKGIVRRRILAKGFGATSTESNPTEARRVEVRIIDLDKEKEERRKQEMQ